MSENLRAHRGIAGGLEIGGNAIHLGMDLLELALNGRQGGVALEAAALPVLTVQLLRVDALSSSGLADEACLHVLHDFAGSGGVGVAAQRALASGAPALGEVRVAEGEGTAQQTEDNCERSAS